MKPLPLRAVVTGIMAIMGFHVCRAASSLEAAVHRDDLVPLAYVRTMVLTPFVIATPPEAPMPARPTTADKAAVAAWDRSRAIRQQTNLLLREAQKTGAESLALRISPLHGISLNMGDTAVPATAFVDNRLPEDVAASLARTAASSHADAALVVGITRLGNRSGIQRQVWLQLKAYLVAVDHTSVRGPYFAIGTAETVRKLMGKGHGKTDSDLVAEAITKATRLLAHTLDTGHEQLFARPCRVAILPASVPEKIEKHLEDGKVSTLAGEPLSRVADVLFQPELTPVAGILENDRVEHAMKGISIESMWASRSQSAPASLKQIAETVKADYLFASRISDVDYDEHDVAVQNRGKPSTGDERHVEIEAEGALIRADDLRILWRDRVRGSTTARTEYVRGQPRIRRDEQCIADAARVAYANLRFSFEEFRKRLERQ